MSENSPESPEKLVMTVDEFMRDQQVECGSVASYVNELAKSYARDNEYNANLLQLKRLALSIYEPNPMAATQSADYAKGFYWGTILGMRFGELLFTQHWSTMQYEIIKNHQAFNYTEAKELESIDAGASFGEFERVRADTLVKSADLFHAMLEDEQLTLPPPYQALIDEWTPQLSDSTYMQFCIENGFNFIFNAAVTQHRINTIKQAEWDVLQRIEDSMKENLDNE